LVDVVVLVKQTVDVSQLRPHVETLEPMLEQAQPKLSDFDLNALEEAIRIREKLGGSVKVVSAGPEVKPLLVREALAMGADEAHILADNLLTEADGYVTANVLAAMIRRLGRWDIILCGEASLDQGAYQTGPRLAEIFGVPHITYVVKAEVEAGSVKAWKAVEGEVQVVRSPMPVVLGVGLEINTPRLPSLLMIRAASKKPIHEVKLSELNLSPNHLTPAQETEWVRAQKVERRGVVLEGAPDEVAERVAQLMVQEGMVKG